MSQSVGLQVAQRIADRMEHFACFPFRQGRLGERGGQRIVGVFEHGVEDDFTGEFGAPAIQQLAQIRVPQTARSLPQRQLRGGIHGGLRHQLDYRAAAIGRRRSFKIPGGIIAAQPLFEKIIPGQGHAFPAFPQLSHIPIMTPAVLLRLRKIASLCAKSQLLQ